MFTRIRYGSIVMLAPVAVLAQHRGAEPVGSGHMNGNGHMMHFWGAGALMWILVAVAVGLAAYSIVRAASQGRNAALTEENALDILKKRYARGEISKAQFEEMKENL